MRAINKVGFLSLLSLIAILGFTMDEKGLIGFLGFLYFARYFFVEPTPFFETCFQKACMFGLMSEFFSFLCLLFGCFFVYPLQQAFLMALGGSFIIAVICFTFSLLYYEWKA